VWLNDNSFIFSSAKYTDPNTYKEYQGYESNGSFRLKELHLPPGLSTALRSLSKTVTGCAGSTIAFADDSTIQFFDIQTMRSVGVLPNTNLSGFKWLTWSPKTKCLMFCADKAGQTNRNLFA